jgi:uncharacterized protein (TIGR03067 family)
MKSFINSMVGGFLLASLAMGSSADQAKQKAINNNRARIHGTWRVVDLVVNGDRSKEEDAKKLTVFNGSDGTWILRSQDKEISRGTSTFDPLKSPKTIDFIPTEGEGRGKTHLGIYELGKNSRRLCFAPPGKVRPVEFSSRPGSQHILVTFERVKAR